MPGWMRDWPVLGVFLFFLFGAVARSQAIYGGGRGVTAGVLGSRGRSPRGRPSRSPASGLPRRTGRTGRHRGPDWPVLGVFLFFLFGAVARSQAIYWVGRGVTAGVLRSRWGDRLDSSQVRRATTTFERWGMPVVPLAFLTVGFQSAVFASVGLLRVHWLRYTLWTIPGCLVWAALWGGSGLAVV